MPLAELIEDLDIYPRHAVDSSHVGDIARAVEAGKELPPIIADQATKRIVDGFHRRRAYDRLGITDVEVELRSYASEADLLSDAVELNSSHGRPLDSQDQTRCALLLSKHGVSTQRIAVVLSTTERHVSEKLLVRVVHVQDPTTGHTETRPAKPVIRPLKGEEPRTITPTQAEIHDSSGGLRAGQVVMQLARELRHGLIDVNSTPGLREKLIDLQAAISEVL